LNAAGRAVGVLHSPAPTADEVASSTITDLERLVTQAGARLGLMRIVERTTLQAATDPLTGLMNRRVVEERAAGLLHRQLPVAVAMADLNHFKVLNDTYGHEAGDRALRLFASTLAASLRQHDLASRYGGEEFLLVFPDLSARAAADVLRRCQEELMVRLGAANVPGFNASYGVADTSQSTDLATLVSLADSALFTAKREGRDRIVISAEVVEHAERRSPSASGG
jgi:diguanylate cyclase (GGDEF)-like protein